MLRTQRRYQGEVHCGDAREGSIAVHPYDVGASRVLMRSTHVTTVEIRIPVDPDPIITYIKPILQIASIPSRDGEILSRPSVAGPR